MPRNITVQFEDGTSHVYQNAPDDTTPEQVTQRAQQEFGKGVVHLDGGKSPATTPPPEHSFLQSAKNVGGDALRTLAAPFLQPFTEGDVSAQGQPPYQLHAPMPAAAPPAQAKPFLPSLPHATTTGEQYASSITSGALGSLLGGPTKPLSMLAGGVSGATSEAAGQATGNNPIARLLAGLAGGFGTLGAAKFRPNNVKELASEATRDVDPKVLQQAAADMESAHAAGVNTNINQHMPVGSNLDVYANTLASNPAGQQVQKNLRAQPRQVEMAAADKMQELPGEVRPERWVANNAQDAATESLKNIRKKAQDEWAKNAPQGAKVPSSALAKFDRQLGDMVKSVQNQPAQVAILEDVRDAIKAKVRTAEQGGSPILDSQGRPINAPDKAPKFLDDGLMLEDGIREALSGQGKRALNTPTLNAKSLRQAQEVRNVWDGILADHAPSLSKAKAAYRNVMESEYEPMKSGVVGYIAQPRGAQADTQATTSRIFSVLDKGTDPRASMSEIKQLGSEMKKAGQPEVFDDAVKTWFSRGIDKALKSSDNRTPEDVAKRISDYFGSIATNTSKTQGVRDMLETVAKNQGMQPKDTSAYIKGFENWMKITNSAAVRPGNVAGTTAADISEAASAGFGKLAGRTSALSLWRQPLLSWSRMVGTDSLKTMDHLLSSPEGVKTLIEMGKQPVMSLKNQALMSAYITSGLNGQNTD
jgi:hypothetical protein